MVRVSWSPRSSSSRAFSAMVSTSGSLVNISWARLAVAAAFSAAWLNSAKKPSSRDEPEAHGAHARRAGPLSDTRRSTHVRRAFTTPSGSLAAVSVPVSVERLHEAVEQFGRTPFLLTVSDDGRPHAVGVVADWDGPSLRAAVGSRSATNAEARPLVSLVWPPFEEGGYNLIVDGDAELVSGLEGTAVLVTPTKAVLHRAAAPERRGSRGRLRLRLRAPLAVPAVLGPGPVAGRREPAMRRRSLTSAVHSVGLSASSTLTGNLPTTGERWTTRCWQPMGARPGSVRSRTRPRARGRPGRCWSPATGCAGGRSCCSPVPSTCSTRAPGTSRSRVPATAYENALEIIRAQKWLRINWEYEVQQFFIDDRWLIVTSNYFYGAGYVVSTLFALDLALPTPTRPLPVLAQHAGHRHAARPGRVPLLPAHAAEAARRAPRRARLRVRRHAQGVPDAVVVRQLRPWRRCRTSTRPCPASTAGGPSG